MAARPGQAAPSMDQFEAYFQRADLDRDGRISGQEAVAFLQGSNLSKQVLAQIWTYSDQSGNGYLGRAEFFNALKLVTVAQSGRELTREIVKAALEGPAAAKIPPPRINALPQVNPVAALRPSLNPMMQPSAQMNNMPSGPSQNIGFHGPQAQLLPNMGVSQQQFTSSNFQFMRPLQSTSTSSSLPLQPISQGFPVAGAMAVPRPPSSSISNISSDWLGSRVSGSSAGGVAQLSKPSVTPSTAQDGFGPAFSAPTVSSRPQAAFLQSSAASSNLLSTLSQPVDKDAKTLVVSGNGFPSDSVFGGSAFSYSQPNQNVSLSTFPSNKSQPPSDIGSISTVSQNLVRPSSSSMTTNTPLQQTQLLVKQNQLDALSSATASTSGLGLGTSREANPPSQVPWPKMTQPSIQKYTKVFLEVDKDRDGKITGEEARNLFLSWRLPREVLKQVWELADQDGDSMLSLREFCIALYMMERYREGRSLPGTLPNSVMVDDALLQATRQPSAAYGGLSWQPSPGLLQQAMPGMQPVLPSATMKPQQHVQMPRNIDGQMLLAQGKSRIPVLESQLSNQLGNDELNALNSRLKEATVADAKVQELENEIMDSKEKLEYYRTKMQELVLYKSRCDNRLNEIIEKASADKREVESLAKKYEEKYKQVGDVASKLAVEDASFRDIQERKLELYNAIVKMEQGGSVDGLLQVRADRVQSELDGLVKALSDRRKKYGLHAKPTALIELPFGWQSGIQEGAADWDEDWDKFEDNGFEIVKELTVDVKNIVPPPKTKPPASSDKVSKDGTSHVSSLDGHKNSDNHCTDDDGATKIESTNEHSEDGSMRSLPNSPPGSSAVVSSSQETHPATFGELDTSPRAGDNLSDHGAAESSDSNLKNADEAAWGSTFDSTDDNDSLWGFNPTHKDSGFEGDTLNSFDALDFGLNPIKTGGSPTAASLFGNNERTTFFDESVPATPMTYSGLSPRYGDGQGYSFDQFSRFDSFSTQGNLARFDSMRSTNDFDSSGLFSQRETLARFDSIRSTRDADHSQGFPSFDDADPFGTGPFKSSGSHTPKQNSDNWSAF